MAVALTVLLLVLILVGIGFAVKLLLIFGLILAALWVAGWLAHPTGRRWYYW